MPKFLIPASSIKENKTNVTGKDAYHLIKVLRIKKGSSITLIDETGNEYIGKATEIINHNISITIENSRKSITESSVSITIAQGMLKDKKMDMLIRHLTELGMTSWQPFFSTRTVPKPDKKRIQTRLERWQRIAIEALKQCGRSKPPDILEPIDFSEILIQYQSFDQKIAFWETSRLPIDTLRNKTTADNARIIVLIGPEGGFSSDEINLASQNGFKVFSLGPRILRAETASIAALTLVQNIFGDLGSKKILDTNHD